MGNELTFRVLFWILFGILLIIRGLSALRVHRAGERLMPDGAAIQREGVVAFGFRFIAFFLLLAFLVIYAVYPPWLQRLSIPLPGWLRWASFLLGLAGIGLLAWTQAELGKQWSAQLQLRENHHLITSGPYARVRHPLYSAMYAFSIAFALLTANWVFVVFAVMVITGLYLRVPKEERMMLEQFGDQYRDYMKQTGRFFPFA
jgi:protein-S-isoprenylcysteine O-methyltransferase Ste14